MTTIFAANACVLGVYFQNEEEAFGARYRLIKVYVLVNGVCWHSGFFVMQVCSNKLNSVDGYQLPNKLFVLLRIGFNTFTGGGSMK